MTITDEMVERALNATTEELPEGVQYALIRGLKAMGWEIAITGSHDVMRAALTAALEGREEPDATAAYMAGFERGKEAAQVRLTIERKIGMHGASYDGPSDARAYTYKHQPGNVPAWKIGEAASAAMKEQAGDYIDRGLSLLLHLEKKGFGVFALVDDEAMDIADAIRGGADTERYRHLKRGTTYRLVGQARVQTDTPLADMDEVTVYRCEQTGDLWARRRSEFEDGRFEKIGGTHDPR